MDCGRLVAMSHENPTGHYGLRPSPVPSSGAILSLGRRSRGTHGFEDTGHVVVTSTHVDWRLHGFRLSGLC